jgi:hypothetical protein
MKTSRTLVTTALLLALTPRALAAPSGPASPPPAAPSAEEAPQEKAAKLRAQGNEAMLAMRYTDGLAAYDQASRLMPDDAPLYYNVARARQLLGDYPEALTALETFDQKASPEQKARVGKLDALFAELRPRVSTLVLKSSVAGARVLVRNKVIGVTPLAPTRLGAGAATLQVELDGFFVESRDVVLPGGGSLELDVSLHKKSTDGLLLVATNPMGATVTVDGRLSGTASPRLELALSAGPHEVLAHREGYDDVKLPILLSPGAQKELAIPMEKSVPLTRKWWFWTGIGAVVAGGIATGIMLTTEKSPGRGTLDPGRTTGP